MHWEIFLILRFFFKFLIIYLLKFILLKISFFYQIYFIIFFDRSIGVDCISAGILATESLIHWKTASGKLYQLDT